jgi:hypothetical protein
MSYQLSAFGYELLAIGLGQVLRIALCESLLAAHRSKLVATFPLLDRSGERS